MPRNPQRHAEIIAAVKSGESYESVAKRYGMTRQAVAQHMPAARRQRNKRERERRRAEKLKVGGRLNQCGACGGRGHNVRACPNVSPEQLG